MSELRRDVTTKAVRRAVYRYSASDDFGLCQMYAVAVRREGSIRRRGSHRVGCQPPTTAGLLIHLGVADNDHCHDRPE